MGYFGKKWNELVYTLTSNDRYAGYHSSKAVKSLTGNDNGDSDNTILSNKYAQFKIDDSSYSVDEKQQAQLVLDSWYIITDIINLDMANMDDEDATNAHKYKSHFTFNSKNYDFDYEDGIDDIEDVPGAEDFLNSLSSPCTIQDLQVAQKHLDVKLPYPVIQYFLVHDGQEIPPSSTRKMGLMYGLQLLSLAEVITLTNYWRRVARKEANAKFLSKKKSNTEKSTMDDDISAKLEKEKKEESLIQNDPNFKMAARINQISEKDLQNYPDLVRNLSTHSKNDYIKKLPEQKSYPENKIKLQYANPNWIPLVTDNTGNQIAIDLDPDVDGVYGQVIIFGREYDTKYVIADNWGEFMNAFALDFEDPDRCKLDYDSDLGQFDLVYLDRNGNVVDQGYLYVLAQRAMGKDV